MLNSINHFIKLQFDDLYNFEYKLSLKESLNKDEVTLLTKKYGNNTSQTFVIEIKDNRKTNTIFVDDSNNYIRFMDDSDNFIKLNRNDGVYVTYKFAEINNLKIGDKVKWHIYGDKKYYSSKIVGFYKDPQVQGLTATKNYIESLGIVYNPDSIYTNKDVLKSVKNVEMVQNIDELKSSIQNMLSMMQKMIIIIIVFAACLDETYDFGVYINIETYVIAAIGTYLVSYVVSRILARKINNIDMVSSLKGDE